MPHDPTIAAGAGSRALPPVVGPTVRITRTHLHRLVCATIAPAGRLTPVLNGAFSPQTFRRGRAEMVERRKPVVTELALVDTLERLVVMINELRADVDLRVQITTDETELVKLTFSGTPDAGVFLQR